MTPLWLRDKTKRTGIAMMSIAFVTTSRGRLHHIRETLPLMLAQGAAEVIVVDFSCPDHTGDWVEANFPQVKVVKVEGQDEFNAPLARNAGVAATSAEWIVLIDGDVRSKPEWMAWMQANLEPGSFYRAAPIGAKRDPETYGTVICRREDFDAVGGYDEVIRGWGGEDGELYRALTRHGLKSRDFPTDMVSAIPHGDEERAGWAGLRNMDEKVVANNIYIAAKQRALQVHGVTRLPVELRRQLMEGTVATLRQWFDDGEKGTLPIRYTFSRSRGEDLMGKYEIDSDVTFTIRIRARDQAK